MAERHIVITSTALPIVRPKTLGDLGMRMSLIFLVVAGVGFDVGDVRIGLVMVVVLVVFVFHDSCQ